MTLTPARPVSMTFGEPDQGDRGVRGKLWGARPVGLHDLVWASTGVRVVRNGTPAPEQSGPVLYLLLPADTLVWFDIAKVLKRLHWDSPDLVRLRLTMTDDSSYRERVVSNGGDLLKEIRREYRARALRTARAWVTPDHRIAEIWRTAPSEAEGLRKLRAVYRSKSGSPIAMEGEIFNGRDPEGVDRWLARTLPRWSRQRAVLPSVYRFSDGVWAHESAEIDENARVIGNAWIGAGARIGPGEVLVGPAVVPDREDPGAPPPIHWSLVKAPHWRLPDLAKAGRARRFGKRAFDIAFSAVVLAATLPFYPLFMLAIFIEDGRPFFFAHRRQTLGGKSFPCLKFRTMRRDADELKAKLMAENVCDGPQFFIQNDPRVLKVGKVMRKLQIDELPQFLNVLAGHMSVVGPRPSPDSENQFCPAWREARLSVRPGITGLWQVRRTREPLTDFQEWIRYDLEYVQHQSWGRDLWIIWQTVWQILAKILKKD